ncbi:Uncharacterised protein [Candidatus Gugararchaeum adminiculabundum]|nr:Uncharacterised protein [Candidatus Gugararchaeum adminiculabundum]
MVSDRKLKNTAALSDSARIESDINQFYENVKLVKQTKENAHVLDLASRYCEDTKYFLGKKDYVTAFGAINYAHGLLDTLRFLKEKGGKK